MYKAVLINRFDQITMSFFFLFIYIFLFPVISSILVYESYIIVLFVQNTKVAIFPLLMKHFITKRKTHNSKFC